MWGFGSDNFGDLTKLLHKTNTNLIDVLTCHSFRMAFGQTHMKLLQFLFQNLMELSELRFPKEFAAGLNRLIGRMTDFGIVVFKNFTKARSCVSRKKSVSA